MSDESMPFYGYRSMYEIYSVESRKGGVGKTTIALNLAKALADLEYDVLLIDCDITGTPITDAASHSPFWKQIVKPISLGRNVQNLIQYFDTVYLKGGGIGQNFSKKDVLEKGMLHLIGSEIYDKKGELIIDPRLLDDLHSHWFVEMIRELADKFEGLSESDRKAVILDNSPGYVGIGKSIREWLTSIGADYAHFLLVSSLDEQDVESTINSAMDIERAMCGKWKVAYLHKQLTEKNGTFDELKAIFSKSPEYESFFYSLEDTKYPSKLDAQPKIIDFVSVVLNKVPIIYHDANIGYKIKDEGSPEKKRIIDALFPLNQNGMPQNIIEYDASISGQFIESCISSTIAGDEQTAALDNACNNLLQKLGKYEEAIDKVKQAASVKNSFDTFQKELIKLGYKPLIDSLGDDLLNQNYVKDLIAFVRTLGNVAIPEAMEVNITAEEILKKDKQLLAEFIEKQGLLKYSATLYSLFDNIYKKAGFSRKTANKYLLMNLSLLFQIFIGVQDESIIRGTANYHLLLMQGYNDKTISSNATYGTLWKSILLINKTYIVNSSTENFVKNYFVEFYQKMCYALLRLIDCNIEYRIIMDSCRTTILRGGRTIDSDVRAYLRSVVTWKTVEFDMGRFFSLNDKPFEMQAVKNALRKIVLDKQ